MKSRAAHLAGWLQLLLAVGALTEVARRFVYGSEPESILMIGMGLTCSPMLLCMVWHFMLWDVRQA